MMSNLYFDTMPFVPENKRERAIELIRIIEMDLITDADIEVQEAAKRELKEITKG